MPPVQDGRGQARNSRGAGTGGAATLEPIRFPARLVCGSWFIGMAELVDLWWWGSVCGAGGDEMEVHAVMQFQLA